MSNSGKESDRSKTDAINETADKICKAVLELRPLSEVSNKACKFNKSLVWIIEDRVIPEIGEEVFSNYCSQMIKRLKTSESNINSLRRIHQFIFGSECYADPYMLSSRKYKVPRFARCLYGAALPEILTHDRCKIRFKLYELCEYSKEEIDYWENYYQKNKHKGRIVHSSLQSLELSENVLSEKVIQQIKNSIAQLLEPCYRERRIPTNSEMRKLVKQEMPELKLSNSFVKASVDTLIIQKTKELREYLFSTQLDYLDPGQDQWEIYVKKAQTLNLRKVDFSTIKSSRLKKELKAIALEYFKGLKRIPDFILILNYLNWFEERFEIESLSELTRDHLLVFFHYLQSRKNLKISTLANYKSIFKQILDLHLKLTGKEEGSFNPAEAITFYNVNGRSEKTESIPGEVVREIEKYLPEMPLQYRLFYELLMETGWRLQDVANLTPTAFSDDPEFPDLIEVTTRISKTGRSRKDSGLKEYLSCFINRSLYERIADFIEDTRKEREFFNIKTCFYGLSRGYPEVITCYGLSHAVNRLIKEHNITFNGKLWRFTTRQTRKTVAVCLINEGAPVSCAQKQLGHLDQRTTEKYYAEVNKMELARKNRLLYESNLEEEGENSKAEQIFFDYFLENPVELPLGLCRQSGRDAFCEKFLSSGCENCPNFCINTHSLEKVLSLKESLERNLKELTLSFEKNGLTYESYALLPEYQALNSQLASLESTLEALRNEQK